MFQASITVKQLIDDVADGMGLYTEIDRAVYRDILNECLCQLYSDVVDERGMSEAVSRDGVIAYRDLPVPTGQAGIRAADVRGVFYRHQPLLCLPPDKFPIVTTADGNFYSLMADGIHLTPTRSTVVLQVAYTVRPQRVGATDENAAVPFPNEYLSLLRAKLRGEAYKLANEDAFAAKWLGEYNNGLAAFAAACRRG